MDEYNKSVIVLSEISQSETGYGSNAIDQHKSNVLQILLWYEKNRNYPHCFDNNCEYREQHLYASAVKSQAQESFRDKDGKTALVKIRSCQAVNRTN